MTPLTCLAIGLAAIAVWWWRYSCIVTPDGRAYLAAARGEPVPSPFRWRLLPRIVGRLPKLWHAVSWAALAASCVLVGLLAERHGLAGWAAAGLFATLPWFRGLVRCPLLTDQVGMAAALGCALLPWWAAIPCALIAGFANEKAPVFAAVFAWSPLPLVGLAVPAAMALLTRHGVSAADHNDWRSMRALHNQAQPHVYLLPWGACLAAVLAPSWQVACAVALGYGSWLVATDRSRLIQWGSPVVILAAMTAIPPQWWGAAILFQVAAPWCDFEKPWK